MALETRSEGSPITALLTQHLHRSVQKSEQVLGTKEVSIELSDDLRVVMYGLGALIAAAEGVTEKEVVALREVANFLDVSDVTKKNIDEAVMQASSLAVGLVALFDAYQEVRRTYPASELAQDEQAIRIERARGLAQEGVLGLPMLDAGEVSEFLGSRSRNQRQYAATLRRRGGLLGLRRSNRYVYPKFQFDPKTGQVYPVIEVVGKILDAGRDPWGAVSWWTSPNPRLPDRQAPMELLGRPTASSDLPALARGMIEPVG